MILPAHAQQLALSRSLVSAHMQTPFRLTAERAQDALKFLDTLPDTAATPDTVITLDGEIVFLWVQGDKRLSIVPDDESLRYAAEFGSERRKGQLPFRHSFLHPTIAKLINAFQREDA